MKDENQRRESFRVIAAGLPAVLGLETGEVPCEVVDLNRAGALLVGRMPRPGGTVDLTLRSPKGDLTLRVRALVRHVENGPSLDELRVGVRFLELGDPEVEVLNALIARVIEGLSLASIQALPANAGPDQVRDALEKIPLQQRIRLAGRAQLREREMLQHDLAAPVLEALARNPQLSPPEARTLLRNPRLPTVALEGLGQNPRFQRDDEIKISIALHPGAGATLPERLIASLGAEGARKGLEHPGLDPRRRQQLLKRLKQT